jgi:hypothetical protein
VITLYAFGPAFGLPDPSPFVTKAEMLLKLAGFAYRTDTKGFRRAPKGKLPYIDDGGAIVADSTFIRLHLERKHGIDFDAVLTPEQRAVAWAVEKMCEDHLYWAVVRDRWLDDVNFEKGPARFFDRVPAPIRPLVKAMIRRKVRAGLKAHGLGRHAPDEIAELARRDIDALAACSGTSRTSWANGRAAPTRRCLPLRRACSRRSSTHPRGRPPSGTPTSSPTATGSWPSSTPVWPGWREGAANGARMR